MCYENNGRKWRIGKLGPQGTTLQRVLIQMHGAMARTSGFQTSHLHGMMVNGVDYTKSNVQCGKKNMILKNLLIQHLHSRPALDWQCQSYKHVVWNRIFYYRSTIAGSCKNDSQLKNRFFLEIMNPIKQTSEIYIRKKMN